MEYEESYMDDVWLCDADCDKQSTTSSFHPDSDDNSEITSLNDEKLEDSHNSSLSLAPHQNVNDEDQDPPSPRLTAHDQSTVSVNGKIATWNKRECSTVVVQPEISSGLWKCLFKSTSDTLLCTQFGIVKSGKECDSNVVWDGVWGVGYDWSEGIWHQNRYSKECERFQSGDIIGLLIDMGQRILSFEVNGRLQSTVVTGIPQAVTIYARGYHQGTTIELISLTEISQSTDAENQNETTNTVIPWRLKQIKPVAKPEGKPVSKGGSCVTKKPKGKSVSKGSSCMTKKTKGKNISPFNA
ncbi:hypothetical protein BLNAU_627 [Blattamonas nauphoetae]|uniref:B30.2/SPRY domain-containing protein n=1 Tax=Blattamonas nauphoetae TaxID=2049346 RepID=A0ABQ9YK11_9EUKA|nr:hypothetical protein BLNAU_627 [Blattamonas nauphoetae]